MMVAVSLFSPAGELFCVVPSFIADHLRKRLAAREFSRRVAPSLAPCCCH